MDWQLFLRPQVFVPLLALSIPVLVVLFAGLKSVIRASRGQPDNFEAWQRELEELRARVDELERTLRGSHDSVPNR